MPHQIQIIKKEEAYSYDELAFLEAGNEVSPLPIQADNFSSMDFFIQDSAALDSILKIRKIWIKSQFIFT